ncbi:Transposon Tf2-6 poly [Paramuricea clavata]|uniref:Transposon Tf2-6 poly n=1 Tax=Paramuricea clavata TaxID=317549 RepID=A0A6S7KG49_PARCT|nr:Transposon Tf2-6 poly [Paramuricea clavata]
MKPVFATLRSRYGHCCLGYIDDSIYIADTVKLSEAATLNATQLITRLGFVVHPTKSIFEPTQLLEFLGFLLNSHTMTVTLTSKKVTKIVAACEHLLKQTSIIIRELASLIGTLVSTFPGVELGPLHYRTLEHDKDLALKRSNGNFDSEMSLSPPSIDDLKWWVSFLPTSYRTIDHGTPHITMTTDASQVGWEATVDGHNTQGLWDAHETTFHINILELLAIQFGLKALLDKVHDQHIRIMSDNTTAISYITSMGGCQSKDCDNIARDIWSWAIARNNWLSASYTPGKHNIIADKLSREFNMTLEWQLNPAVFDKTSYHFSKPGIDLFASRINHQLDIYVSWKPDPGASFVDAFTINWALFDNSFAFPPFCLITRCLQKVVQEQATMIIVVPMWTTQLTEHIKQNRPGNVFSTFHVSKYHQEELCVYRTLKCYLYRTATLRSSTSTRLLISYVKPHGAVTTNTLSRWIKQLLTLSGIDTSIFKAHSTRAASVSKVAAFLPVDVILKHVGWSSDCVFRKHYNKPIVDNNLFQNAVLQ